MTIIEGVMRLIILSLKRSFSMFWIQRLSDKCNVGVYSHWFAGSLFMNGRVAWS